MVVGNYAGLCICRTEKCFLHLSFAKASLAEGAFLNGNSDGNVNNFLETVGDGGI